MALVIRVDPERPDPAAIGRAAATLTGGGLVAFPTETVYGLGADARNAEAVAGIFRAKARPADDPLIVHVLTTADLLDVAAVVTPLGLKLAEAFWPGPLTLVVEQGPSIPSITTAGLDSVAVRSPAHPVSRALLSAAEIPVAAPSANTFGRTSPTTAGHVLADLGEHIDVILDAGPTPLGLESTVVDTRGEIPVVLRPGGVPMERIGEVAPGVILAEPVGGKGPEVSPGRLGRHYAPRASLVLLIGDEADVHALVVESFQDLAGSRVGLMVSEEDLTALPSLPSGVVVKSLGPGADLSAIARRLYAAIRELDEAGVDVIIAREYGTRGLGLAIRDRLVRAAQGQVIRVPRGASSDAAGEVARLIQEAGPR